ncbi:MAG TPA: inositol monophosphatase family protein [Bacteroidota bacterium]
MADLHQMLETATDAAREAGAFLKESVGRVKNIEQKLGQFRNLVSEIDKGSEAKIIAAIKGRYPDHAILAEESGGTGGGSDYTWIIDPLDGTTNFLHGVPIFCATIGIEHRGEIIAGVSYDPNRDELFAAERGSGAFLNGERLSVTAAGTLRDALMVTGFPYHLADTPEGPLVHFNNFTRASQGIRRLGSAALDLAYVAAGRFDGFWEISLNPWDMAAGVLIVREAGGRVTDFQGRPVDIYRKEILATNGRIHEECMAVLRKGSASAT